jgi:hypothetical protein
VLVTVTIPGIVILPLIVILELPRDTGNGLSIVTTSPFLLAIILTSKRVLS